MISARKALQLVASVFFVACISSAGAAQERLPWQKDSYGREAPPSTQDPYNPGTRNTAPPTVSRGTQQPTYGRAQPQQPSYKPDPAPPRRQSYNYQPRRYPDHDRRKPEYDYRDRHTYSENEILNAGHHFFGSISNGLARAIAKLFRSAGRPNGYILGEDAGGAFVAGLRYGEGTLYTKTYGARRIYWQGPTVGYDFGGEGSRTMTLVYNMRSPRDAFGRFAGVQGSAYVVGGVGVQFLKRDDVTIAPIRSGVGLRLGANIGYLKYTPRPTWNPF